MYKEITLAVPKHVKKFIISHTDYVIDPKGVVYVPKISELGRLIHCVSRVIPYTQRIVPVSGDSLTLRYTCRTKAFDIPVEKYPDLVRLLEEMFRASLVRQVSAIQSALGDSDYSWMVRQVLALHNIIVDDSQAKDMDFETARKIYRDHLSDVDKKNLKKRRLFAAGLSA
jgi:hypothetical protein